MTKNFLPPGPPNIIVRTPYPCNPPKDVESQGEWHPIMRVVIWIQKFMKWLVTK